MNNVNNNNNSINTQQSLFDLSGIPTAEQLDTNFDTVLRNIAQPRQPVSLLDEVVPNFQDTSIQNETNQAAHTDAVLAEIQKNQAEQKPKSSMTEVSTNFIDNWLNNQRELGTAWNYLWVNKGELIKEAPDAIKKYLKSHDIPDIYADIANAMVNNYNIDVTKMEGRNPLDVIQGMVAGAYAKPVDFFIDAVSLGADGVVKKVIENIPGLSRVVKSGTVEKALAAEQKSVTQDVLKAGDSIAEANKAAKEAGFTDLESAIQSAEELGKSKFVKDEATQKVWDKLKAASDNIDELDKVYSPSTYVGKERTSIITKIMRDREKLIPGITYEQIRREVTPFLDEMDNIGIDKFAEKYETLSKQRHLRQADAPALEVANAKRMFDKGEILPITHMTAEVNKQLGKDAIHFGKMAGDINMAGRFSNRAYGNATYKAIAEQWAKPQEYLTNLMNSYLEGGVANSILKGEFAPVSNGVGKLSKASYLDRQLLEQGKLKEALSKARPEPLGLDDIAIDNDVLAPLKSQMQANKGAFGGFIKDAADTLKGVMLSTGQYLGPNVITGATNALLNSGPMIVSDIIEAIKSQGRLSKQLGVHRYPAKLKVSKNPLLRPFDIANNFIGSRFNKFDRNIQNVFAEMAAHRELRKKGIPFDKRMQAIDDMDKMKLGEVITDIKRAALINSPKTLLPDTVTDFISIFNPFWRWTDTATQATYNTIKKNPLLANVILTDIAANIGFDKEMQNRMNLHVDLDKPYVTFKFDPKSNQMKTISAEFIPALTTIKFADPKTYGERPVSFSTFGPILQAFGGLDRYGRPMKRPIQGDLKTAYDGTKRFQSGQGQPWHEIYGKGDEILNTAVKSLIGPVNLYNRTIAPLVSSVISPTGQYYQPYDMATFGGYNREDLGNNAIFAGNPARGRTAQDVINAFLGRYEQEYHPEFEQMTPTRNRSLTRQFMRGQMRLQGEGY